MPNDIIVSTDASQEFKDPEKRRESTLCSWVIDNVDRWTKHRNSEWEEKWDEYYRIYRGRFSAKDKSRKSERSQLISPATQQAVETAVAELEEATFGKGDWFTLDETEEALRSISEATNIRLSEDLDKNDVPAEIAKVYLLSALYGTGIGKIHIEQTTEKRISPDSTGSAQVSESINYDVTLEAVDPRDFAIDTAATSIEDALGCAHTMYMPLHLVQGKMASGEYMSKPIGATADKPKDAGRLEPTYDQGDDVVKVVEYHGYVPADLLPIELEDDEEFVDLLQDADIDNSDVVFDDTNLVEAIIVIGNDGTLLKATRNELLMKDRAFVSFQYDTIPNRFWGRGIVEKGYNVQKALDAELRARIDAMALAAHPMIGVDATQLPRGANLTASAGKVWLANGDPSRTFVPLQFSGASPATFSQAGELERMLSMATGTMDSAAPTGVSPRNATASGMSMMQGGFVKRSKRTMQNVTRDFLEPLLTKIMWRYMEFRPSRYPAFDFNFKAIAGIGLIARELEANQMINLMSIVPQGSTEQLLLLKGVIDSSSLDIKDDLMASIDQSMQPDPQAAQEQQIARELQVQEAVKALEKTDSEIFENYANGQSKLANAEVAAANVSINAQRADTERFKTQLEAVLKRDL